MSTKERSAKIRTLMKDDTFQDVVTEVIERQVSVFLDPDSSTDDRDSAHDVVRAIRAIQDYMDSVIADDEIQNRREKNRK